MGSLADNFKINIVGLTQGVHQYSFEYGDEFFSENKSSLIRQGKGICLVELVKSVLLVNINLTIKGTIKLVCDRSLEMFDYPVEINQRIVFKYDSEEKEIDENMYLITDTTAYIDLLPLIYEFLTLSVPMKKIHPNYLSDDPKNDFFIYCSDNKNVTDPRWEALRKIKTN